MTADTLRNAILDHRCPNCGTTMEKRPPKKPLSVIGDVVTLLSIAVFAIVALATAAQGHWAEASYFLVFAVFVVVTDR